jgi:hypothetical protein
MFKSYSSSRNVLLSFEKDRGHFDKSEFISRKVGDLEKCKVYLKPWGPLDEKDGFIETSLSRVIHGHISKLDSLSKRQGWPEKDDPFQIS